MVSLTLDNAPLLLWLYRSIAQKRGLPACFRDRYIHKTAVVGERRKINWFQATDDKYGRLRQKLHTRRTKEVPKTFFLGTTYDTPRNPPTEGFPEKRGTVSQPAPLNVHAAG